MEHKEIEQFQCMREENWLIALVWKLVSGDES